jgi:hypothetical protein
LKLGKTRISGFSAKPVEFRDLTATGGGII